MLRFQKSEWNRIVRHCEEGYPREVCGLLLGKSAEGQKQVKKIHPAKNLSKERAFDRYELDPLDFNRADQEARSQGLDIIGFYHSHPDHPAVASPTDKKKAWEGYSYLILSIKHQKLDHFKSWRLNRGKMVEEETEVLNGES